MPARLQSRSSQSHSPKPHFFGNAPVETSSSLRRLRRWSRLLVLGALPFHLSLTLSVMTVPPAVAAETPSEGPGVVATKQSKLAPIALPSGAFRYTGQAEVAQFTEGLKTIAAKNQLTLGSVEVLVWGNGKATKTAIPDLLKQSGYIYEAEPPVKIDGGQATAMLAVQKEKKQGLLGLWMEQGDTLILAWAEAKADARPTGAASPTDPKPVTPPSSPSRPEARVSAPSGSTVTLDLDASTQTVNVMKGEMPKIPVFPTLPKKPGTVRGYVFDMHGKPLKGAVIGARSTAAGGFYSGASGKTDAKGYYEIAVPVGAAHYYCAGYAVDYGEGRAGMGLHPADGEADSFATANGAVENWVLLPYGIANRDDVQDNPRYMNNYYGGGIVFSFSVSDGGALSSSTELPANSEIEVTLMPDGPLVDGSAGRTFVLRKKAGTFFAQLYVNNIPVGHYKITARLSDGGELRMKETGPNGGQMFGLEPKQAVGSAGLWLRPGSAKPEMTTAAHGNWDTVSISLDRP